MPVLQVLLWSYDSIQALGTSFHTRSLFLLVGRQQVLIGRHQISFLRNQSNRLFTQDSGRSKVLNFRYGFKHWSLAFFSEIAAIGFFFKYVWPKQTHGPPMARTNRQVGLCICVQQKVYLLMYLLTFQQESSRRGAVAILAQSLRAICDTLGEKTKHYLQEQIH